MGKTGPRKKKDSAGRPGRRFVPLGLAATALVAAIAGYVIWQRDDDGSSDSFSFQIEADAVTFAAYAGSAACRDCHQEAYKAWADSHHALAEREYRASVDQPAFDPPRRFRHGTQSSEARLEETAPVVVTVGRENGPRPYAVSRVIGVDPLRQFMVESAGGRLQVTEVAYDPHRAEWFNVYGEEDRKPGEWGHWSGRGMNWNSMCAACHNTRLRKNYDASQDAYATTTAEMGVGCEACHGPMASHVRWQRENAGSAVSEPELARFTRDQYLDVCASCHSRRSELTGDFRPGDPYLDHYSPAIPDASDVYYPDGQVRDENYEYVSFLSSRMSAAGVQCSDCHDSHSAKVRETGNALCMRCHDGGTPGSPKIDPEPHGRHAREDAGGSCVGCHMPLTVYMQRHPRRDHGFTIPDPLLTKEHGIPNACNRCHGNRSVDWAVQTVETWYGSRMKRLSRDRARSVARGRALAPGAYEDLLKMAGSEKQGLWRATALYLLQPSLEEPGVLQAILDRLKDPDPLVRGTAALALGPAAQAGYPAVLNALKPLLADPVRKVRVDSGWSLRGSLEETSVAGRDLLRYLEQVADQPTGALQTGVYHLDRRDIDRALPYFRRAVEWDPRSAALRHELAVALGSADQPHQAVRELEEAVRLEPTAAQYHYKLGLARNEAGDLEGALRALEESVRLEPGFDRAWYNLGLAHSALGRVDAALHALARAESLRPDSPAPPYARATILARLGRADEARAAARKALAIDPSFADAARLLATLDAR